MQSAAAAAPSPVTAHSLQADGQESQRGVDAQVEGGPQGAMLLQGARRVLRPERQPRILPHLCGQCECQGGSGEVLGL